MRSETSSPGTGWRSRRPWRWRELQAGPLPDAARSTRSGRGRRLLRWIGTAGLGVYLLSRTDPGAVAGVMARLQEGWLAAAILLYAVDRWIAGVKWRAVYNVEGYRITIRSAIDLYLRSSFLGAMLPATVGTDLIRAHLVAPGRNGLPHALGSVVTDRFLGVVALLLTAAAGTVALAPPPLRAMAGPIVTGAAVLVAAALLVLVTPIRPHVDRRRHGPLSRAAGFIAQLLQRLKGYANHRGAIGLALLLACTQQLLLTLINWLLALALGLDLAPLTMLWVWPLVMIAIRMPFSIMGFGVRELALLQLLDTAGFTAEEAVALGVLSGLVDLLFIGIGGGLVLAAREAVSAPAAPAATASEWGAGSKQ